MAGIITLCGLLSPEGELEEGEGYGHIRLAERRPLPIHD
jgi:hypothetical protein